MKSIYDSINEGFERKYGVNLDSNTKPVKKSLNENKKPVVKKVAVNESKQPVKKVINEGKEGYTLSKLDETGKVVDSQDFKDLKEVKAFVDEANKNIKEALDNKDDGVVEGKKAGRYVDIVAAKKDKACKECNECNDGCKDCKKDEKEGEEEVIEEGMKNSDKLKALARKYGIEAGEVDVKNTKYGVNESRAKARARVRK